MEGAQVDLGKRYRIFNSIFGEWQIAKGLKYRVNFGPDMSFTRSGLYLDGKSVVRSGTSYASLSRNENIF